MRILTINSGSSSIKFSIYNIEKTSEARIAVGAINNIGLTDGGFHVKVVEGAEQKKPISVPDHNFAIKAILDWLETGSFIKSIDGVGHRVVHGGRTFKSPAIVTDALLTELRNITHLAPNHLPHEILAIESFRRFIPEVKQVACFDTAFHCEMPQTARAYPLPRYLTEAGIVRYGFHGLSYEYVINALAREAASKNLPSRVVIAHLGHGASMAAIKDGKCVDTTMGFTPAGGLVMSTRTGDLDPGVILYLLMQKGMTPEEVSELVYKKAGLLGVSGSSADMKELLEKANNDPMAKEATSLFCYQAKKTVGAFTAVLGGLDVLVFTGGIGENAPYVRHAICDGLEYLGINIDEALNEKNETIISKTDGGVIVRVIKTNEELMVARHTCNALTEQMPLEK
ncbi:acetate/propionate family kinase [bacterium]|nr:MAG: acetate/propionate family kinase [bacterium]